MTIAKELERPLAPTQAPTRHGAWRAAALGTLYVAVVHAADGVRFAAATESRAELVRRLAEYVRARGDAMLWADGARHLRALLIRGELEAAVEVYFGLVGERWDDESLVTAVVAAGDAPNVAVSVGAVAHP